MMPSRQPPRRRPGTVRPPAAFTLIEVLTAMSVLFVVMLLSLQLFDGAARATAQSHRHMDISSEARQVLDRFGEDFNAMVRRADVDSKFDKKIGSDAVAFYAEAAGYAANGVSTPRMLATLDYRVHRGNGTPDVLTNFKLERGARALAYNEMFFSNPPTPYAAGSQTYFPGRLSDPPTFNTLPLIRAEDYTVVGDQTFRFEFCFLLKNGHFSRTPNPPDDVAGAGNANYRPDPGNFRQVAALVIAVVMLDTSHRVLLGDPKGQPYLDSFGKLSAAFPDVDPDATLTPDPSNPSASDILTVWQPIIAKIAAKQEPNTAALPGPVLENLRVFQRYYYWK